jgi:uncharacterized RDD family membrane protein YckC
LTKSADQENLSDFPRAGLLRRLSAVLYDGFLVVAIWMLIGFIVQLIVGPDINQLVDGQVQTNQLLDNILFVLMMASSASFYIGFWSKSGQTLGMLAWRIKLVSINGNLITPVQGGIRYLTAWPAFFLLGLGYLWLLVDKNGDAAHDKLSHTKIIRLPKDHRPF